MLQVRQPVHHDFKRDGDLLLHLFGRAPGPLRDDLDVVIGHIGVGFDGQSLERDNAPREQQDRDEKQEAVVEREIDQAANHGRL